MLQNWSFCFSNYQDKTTHYKKGDYHTVLKTENAKLKAYQALTTLKLNAYFFCYINFFNGKIHHKTLLCMCLKDDMAYEHLFADGSNMDFKIVHMMVGSKTEHHFLFQYKCHNFSLLALTVVHYYALQQNFKKHIYKGKKPKAEHRTP